MGRAKLRQQEANARRVLSAQLAFRCRPVDAWVFSDEAGVHAGNRYFGLGAVFVQTTSAGGATFGDELIGLAEANQWFDEMKWSKVGVGNVHRYRRIVELFFSAGEAVQFHCIVVDRQLLSKPVTHSLLFRFYSLLLAHRLRVDRHWGPTKRAVLVPDRIERSDLDWRRLYFSVNAMLKRRSELRRNCLVGCVPTDSATTLEVQVADILLGATVAHYNGKVASATRAELSNAVVKRIHDEDRQKASVWLWHPSEPANPSA